MIPMEHRDTHAATEESLSIWSETQGKMKPGDARLSAIFSPPFLHLPCRIVSRTSRGSCLLVLRVAACPKLVIRFVERVKCRCPNHGLGCEAVVGVLMVERHLREECEWREEECPRCHQQVHRAEMGRHQDTTCAAKPMPCGFADAGCETRCPQGDLAAHERDGVVAHVGLLRQQLAATKGMLTDLAQSNERLGEELTATKGHLAQTQLVLVQSKEQLGGELAATKAELAQTQHDLAHTQERMAILQAQLVLLVTPPPTPEGLEATPDAVSPQIAVAWRPVEAPACTLPAIPIRYRVTAEVPDQTSPTIVYTGPECRCMYVFPPGAAEARLAVVAMRGLAESGPSAPVSCTRPRTPGTVFTYDHDMDEQGLFHYIGTQGHTQPWQNPAEAGWVTTTRSKEPEIGNNSDPLGRQPCNTWFGRTPNSWWQVDLGATRLFVTQRYTLRHNNLANHERYRLQSWRLEGSLDGASWRTLDEHTNEPNAIPARPDAMATFIVAPAQAFPARYLRVLTTGTNAGGDSQFPLSGFEMYGTLCAPTRPQ
ncbi:putative E3 ubiquitin-protein ligase HECTD1 [Paratrimastix pyriformis]|uniref:E3 ubiquitin-protein ligase HECTD1 n=1 Tax=Paratrimastix pyriformis TaxID=342808 RepID=A0ABQ8UEZ9_9EUKA|nr:putative E3 ubiquitin-protein ligase HECTD1 [Paratrimastix pyriformis]